MNPLSVSRVPFVLASALAAAVPAAAQWMPSSTGLPQTSGIYHGQNLVIKGGGNLFVAANNSLHRSADNAATWTDIFPGLPAGARISHIAATATRLYVAYYTSNPTTGGFHYSTNAGTTWTNTNITIGNNYISGLAASGDTAVAYSGGGQLYRSTDAGANWAPASVAPPTQSGNVALLNGVLYASGDNGLHRSTNLGDSWTQVSVEAGYTLAASGSTLYYGGRPQLRRSTDNGLTWTTHGTGFPVNVDMSTLVAKDSILVAPFSRLNFGSGVHLSTDGGATWSAINDGFAGANPKISSLVEKDGILYATAAGVFKRPLSGAAGALTAFAPPARRLRAEGAGPGRFNLVAPVGGPAQVKVHAADGSLVWSRAFAEGLAHGASVDLSTASAGVYSVSVSAPGFRERLRVLR